MPRALTSFAAAALCVVVLIAVVSPAAAAVPQSLTVRSGGAQVRIETAPFRLAFTNARTGRAVLQEVPPNPAPVGGGGQVEGTGGVQAGSQTVYSPLAFQVGGEKSAQWFGIIDGDQLLGAQAGTWFIPQAISSVQSVPGGYQLTAQTSDPTGRTMTITVTADAGSAIRVRASLSDASNVSGFSDSFAATPGEAFHGFGGRHNSLNQAGNSLYSWTEEESIDCGAAQPQCGLIPGAGGNGYMLPSGGTQAYYPLNDFTSSDNYSFLANDTELTRWRLGTPDNPSAWQVNVAAPSLDYSVVVGDDGPAAIRGLTQISGHQVTPPDWAEGPTVSRAIQVGTDSHALYQQKIESDVDHIIHDRLAGKPLPIKDYAYEAWHYFVTFHDEQFIRQTNARLRAAGIHPVGYIRPFLYYGTGDSGGGDSGAFNDPGQISEAVNNNYVADDGKGNPEPFDSPFGSPTYLVDFSNPAAVGFWDRQLQQMLDLGFDGFMQDFGEQVTNDLGTTDPFYPYDGGQFAALEDNMHFHDGETGASMHNRYPLLYHQATRDFINRYMATHPGRQIFFFTRAGFSGRPGTPASENGNFPGDEQSQYSTGDGLPSIIPDMLNRSVGGALGYNTDVGGYIDTSLPPGLELRWAEAAAFTPYFRQHNATPKMPWDFGSSVEATWAAFARLHDRALPLMRSLWQQFATTGIPIDSPLWLFYPHDPQAAGENYEFMLGPHLLAAPVVLQSQSEAASGSDPTSESVYFPAGCWEDQNTYKQYQGPSRHTINAPIDRLPYFFTCGTDPLASGSPGFPSPKRSKCARPSGALHGRSLGPVRLGRRASALTREFRAVSKRGRPYTLFFCLRPRGIHLGVAPPRLLRALPKRERRRYSGRVVLALTADRYYTLRGAKIGQRIKRVARRLHLGRGRRVGHERWYFIPNGSTRGVIMVRHGRIDEIGITFKPFAGVKTPAWPPVW